MTNFQNPVGASMPEAKKQELVELLRRHQVPLIEDDVYAELYYAQQAPKPAKAFDTEGLVMHCGSFAKSLAPGYRIGWVAAGRFAQKIERLKLMTSLCASMPAQAAIADYLQHGGYDRHLRKLRYALEGQQANMLAAIARHFPAQTRSASPPAATSCGWNCPSRWTRSSCSTWRWRKASASPRGRSSRPPGALATASA
jgi:DNA-binding transcriptional MocR family regulator